jgi:hypothetical protein
MNFRLNLYELYVSHGNFIATNGVHTNCVNAVLNSPILYFQHVAYYNEQKATCPLCIQLHCFNEIVSSDGALIYASLSHGTIIMKQNTLLIILVFASFALVVSIGILSTCIVKFHPEQQ